LHLGRPRNAPTLLSQLLQLRRPQQKVCSSKQFLIRDFKLPTDFTCFLFFDCYFIPYNGIRNQKLQQVKYAQDGS
jgi:hypothetical protein